MHRQINFRLYLITDRKLSLDLKWTVEEALKAGVKAVQIREKDLSAKELIALTKELQDITNKHSAKLFINDRADIALGLGLDGVHLGTQSLTPDIVERISGGKLLIGASTHSLDEAMDAEARGADFITFGPVYETPSKLRYGKPVGIKALKEVTRRIRIPVFAIGGINKKNIPEVIDAGAYGIALISAIMASESPGSAARELIEKIQRSVS
ncbi:MAG: thiamine phosphate synthase [Thermodesulfovibrionales bacterium]|nr:thiamine phosphate synthase [Thermodesulfovibrionales bacterium]